ncbi:MAG TPA: hypothetical protein GXZ89_05895 [Fastidiosipila sp.]|nr:hypothetical protein [Fastidiosipila sp.]
MRELYLKQKVFKITDHYPIYDKDQNVVYQVDQDFRLVGNTVHVSRPNVEHVFTVNKKIFALLPQFTVDFADHSQLMIKQRLTFMRRKIDIISDTMNLQVEGNWLDLNFTVLKDGQALGTIKRAWISWGDMYELKIFEPAYETVFVAIVIAVDALIDDQASSTT